mmetsp:Transcript_10268/g.25206  ORF Transcript_10268/g.25206 Transcript_10268/m.25206 type:complete len:231 (+) Transcript_10268:245-937(+)
MFDVARECGYTGRRTKREFTFTSAALRSRRGCAGDCDPFVERRSNRLWQRGWRNKYYKTAAVSVIFCCRGRGFKDEARFFRDRFERKAPHWHDDNTEQQAHHGCFRLRNCESVVEREQLLDSLRDGQRRRHAHGRSSCWSCNHGSYWSCGRRSERRSPAARRCINRGRAAEQQRQRNHNDRTSRSTSEFRTTASATTATPESVCVRERSPQPADHTSGSEQQRTRSKRRS